MDFTAYKKNIIGDGIYPAFNENGKKILYADWAASGRLYWKIEKKLLEEYAPYYSNIHSNGNYIANRMENAYESAREKILKHFGCDSNYCVIASGYGMTAAIKKFIDILSASNRYKKENTIVLLTQYEHNSNFITWREYGYSCEILDNASDGQIDLCSLEKKIQEYRNYNIVASLSACSNVSGIVVELDKVIEIIKKSDGLVCVDYTTIAPYKKIDVSYSQIDALMFSAHKFLGGVGGPGVLILKKNIYKLSVPSSVGGGVVNWVNPTGKIIYKDNISAREEAGTPPIMQLVKLGLAIDLKESMGSDNIYTREKEITKDVLVELKDVNNLTVYDGHISDRLPIFSFNISGLNYQQIVSWLNKKYGIQARGGCCCASIYGHKLLNISNTESEAVARGEVVNMDKYGWVRISLAPVLSDEEVRYICNAIKELGDNSLENTILEKVV